jgi:hypothetical protein
VPGDVKLRGQILERRSLNLEVNVRCSARVGNWLDGAKPVATVGIGRCRTEALEVRVQGGVVGVTLMMVASVGVALSYLDACLGHRRAVLVEYATIDVANHAHRILAAISLNQVIVTVERQLIRVERAGRLGRGGNEMLCRTQQRCRHQQRTRCGQANQEPAATGFGHGASPDM